MRKSIRRVLRWAPLLCSLSLAGAQIRQPPPSVSIDWNKTILVSRSTPTLQVVVNPMLRRGASMHDGSFSALKNLNANYVRYVPWLPYPKLGVAELDPPTSSKTSWDFSLIDPMTKDFFAATQGHPVILNFSTAPAWLFKTDKPVIYPPDPDQVDWHYTQGTELTDPSGKQLGDYYGRLVSWYVNGGFTDENGKQHHSGYHYSIPIWEVLNEPEFEHKTTPEQYTARYDAIVAAIHRASPKTKFMALALAEPSGDPVQWYDYFLNPAHHKPGIPIDYISYHFYASPTLGQGLNEWQYTFFDQADRFITTTRFVESIRKRLSPATKTDTDELGVILPLDNEPISQRPWPIPTAYWNAAGSLYAYLYINLARQGIDVIGESQLVGYPSQFPSVSMMDWKSNKPNARYWVLKLIKDNFGPGDKLVETSVKPSPDIEAQAFVTYSGKKLLLLNKRNRAIDVTLPGKTAGLQMASVDEATGESAARVSRQTGAVIHLAPFAVTVVRW